jgi:hypothetical protein
MSSKRRKYTERHFFRYTYSFSACLVRVVQSNTASAALLLAWFSRDALTSFILALSEMGYRFGWAAGPGEMEQMRKHFVINDSKRVSLFLVEMGLKRAAFHSHYNLEKSLYISPSSVSLAQLVRPRWPLKIVHTDEMQGNPNLRAFFRIYGTSRTQYKPSAVLLMLSFTMLALCTFRNCMTVNSMCIVTVIIKKINTMITYSILNS